MTSAIASSMVVGLVRGEQRGDDLRVRRRAERRRPRSRSSACSSTALIEVAVVAERDLAPVGAPDGLGVLPRVRARGRVADVADRHVALQRAQLLLVEDLVDEALVAHGHDVAALRRGDAGRLLPAVLQRVEGEVRQAGDVVAGGVDAEDAALVARSVAGIEEGGLVATDRTWQASNGSGRRPAAAIAANAAGARRIRDPFHPLPGGSRCAPSPPYRLIAVAAIAASAPGAPPDPPLAHPEGHRGRPVRHARREHTFSALRAPRRAEGASVVVRCLTRAASAAGGKLRKRSRRRTPPGPGVSASSTARSRPAARLEAEISHPSYFAKLKTSRSGGTEAHHRPRSAPSRTRTSAPPAEPRRRSPATGVRPVGGRGRGWVACPRRTRPDRRQRIRELIEREEKRSTTATAAPSDMYRRRARGASSGGVASSYQLRDPWRI